MRTVLIPAILLSLVAVGCAGGDGASSDGRTTIVAAFFPLAEAARVVAGDDVEVVDLTPAGVEPHDLELTTDQVDELLDADLAVILGGDFQPAVEEVAEDRDGPTVVVLDELGIEADDPHVWLDPLVMADIVDAVANALGEREAPAFRRSMQDLDDRMRAALGSCASDVVVASHEAYRHLTDRYGLRLETIAGLTPEAEPDPSTLDHLADLIERDGVTTIFTEPLAPRGAAEALARETGAKVAVLDPLESDPGMSYEQAMETNLAALEGALGCR